MKFEPIKNIISIQKVILIVVGLGLYANSLKNDFALDDTMMITDNNFTKGGWEGLKRIFTTDAFTGFLGEGKTLLPGGRYRPLSQAIFNVYYSAFGLNPFGLHLINILLFAISILLLFKVLRNIFQNKKEHFFNLAFLTTLFYAIHPLNTEVVANIKSMDLILSMIFSLIALYYALKFTSHGKYIYLLWIGISLFLGLLSKENTITFVALIPLILFLFKRPKAKGILLPFLTLSIIASLYLIIRYLVIGFTGDITVNELLNNPFLGASPSEKYATILYTWLYYLKLIIFPHPLTHDYYPYVIEIKNMGNIWVIISTIVFTVGSFFSLRHLIRFFQKKEGANIYLFGFMFFMTIFSISSNLIFNIGTFMNERFLFVADVGIFIIFAQALLMLKEKYFKKDSRFGLILLLFILPYSIKTFTRNPVWKNDFILFRTDVEVSSNSAKCTVSAGGKTLEAAQKTKNKVLRKKLLKEAKTYVSRGLKIHPKYFQGWELLGNINYEMSKWDEALVCYENCLLLSKSNAGVLNNINNLAIKSAEDKNLIISNKAINQLLKHKYKMTNSLFLKAINLEKEMKIDSSIKVLQSIIASDSLNSNALNKLGQIYGQYMHDFKISEHFLMKAYDISPTNHSILENLGTLYAIEGKNSKALYFFKESYKINPENRQIYQNISNVYRSMGMIKKAEEWIKRRPK